jgi:hypothetical protein
VEPKANSARRMLVAKAAERDTEDAQGHSGAVVLELAPPVQASAAAQASGLPAEKAAMAPLRTEAAAPAPVQRLQPPATPARVDARGGTVILENGSNSTVPSLLGLSMRGAIEAAHRAGFELQVVGSGVAREQQPPPGAYLPPGSKIAVRFSR